MSEQGTGRYRKLYPRLWRHPGFRKLKPAARELTFYLLTGPQTNRIGLFHFSVGTASEDLNVGRETLLERLVDVRATFGWHFDADERVFYIPSWWRWNRPENENVLKGNLKDLSEIAPCALVDAFAANLETLPATFHQTFLECIDIRLPKRSPIQEQEHLQEHLQEHTQEPRRASRGLRKASNGVPNDLIEIVRTVEREHGTGMDTETFVDHMRSYTKQAFTKPQALEAIAIARSTRVQ